MRRYLLLLTVLFFSAAKAENIKIVPSSLKTVMLYRSGAELTHTSTVVLMQGHNEVIIENISFQLDPNSIQINAPSTVTIMGVQFMNNYLSPAEVAPSVKLLQDSLESAQKDQERIDVEIKTTMDLLEVLKANRDIKGAQTGLSVSELIRLMDYYKIKSAELQNELAQLKEKRKRIENRIVKLQNQIREEEKKYTYSTGRLHLQLSAAAAGKADLTISYITPQAYWTPYYDVRAENIKSPIKIIYRAKMVQTTGIDWKKVKLSLSTSVPAQWGDAPVLNAWFLSYINPVAAMDRRLMNSIQSFGTPAMAEAPVAVYIDERSKVNAEMVYIVNGVVMPANEFSKISPSAILKREFIPGDKAASLYGAQALNGAVLITLKNGLEDYVTVTNSELNVTFDIDLPYDVPSNGKEQSATLRVYETNAMYKYYAVPKIDKDAFLLAEIADWEKLDLLPGEANIIFEGTYVGKSFIDPNSTLDTLNLTLGKDKRVVTKREKLADFSSVKFLGSTKLQKMTYEISVRNNKKELIKMLLKDQFPLSTNKEIEVELVEDGGAEVNAEKGILNWKLEIAPGETKKVRFAYTVKYPRDKVINLN